MPTVNIPATIEDAISELDGIGALLTAKQWERAANVWAFTEPQQGRRNLVGKPTKLTVREFAELGIAGLQHHETVAAYRNAWQAAINSGHAKAARPGRPARLPDIDWPTVDYKAKNRPAERVARAVREIEATPELAKAVIKSPVVRAAIDDAIREEWVEKDRARQRRRTEYEREFPEARRMEERAEESLVSHELAKAVLCLNTVIKTLPDCGPMNVEADLEAITARVEAIRAFTTGGGIATIEAFANEARA